VEVDQGSKFVEESKEREIVAEVDEKDSQKIQIETLQNQVQDMTRKIQEKENLAREVDQVNQEKKLLENSMREMAERFQQKENEMENCVKDLEKRLQERENDVKVMNERIIRQEETFTMRINEMESRNEELTRRLEEQERVLQGSLGRMRCLQLSLPLPPNKQTHVFLTHTWRNDEKGRNNHDRVGRVNEALRERGLVTWFDSERMKGTVRQAMTDALNATCCVLVFVTKKYEEKVNSRNQSDNCYFEFNVAAHDEDCVSDGGMYVKPARLARKVEGRGG